MGFFGFPGVWLDPDVVSIDLPAIIIWFLRALAFATQIYVFLFQYVREDILSLKSRLHFDPQTKWKKSIKLSLSCSSCSSTIKTSHHTRQSQSQNKWDDSDASRHVVWLHWITTAFLLRCHRTIQVVSPSSRTSAFLHRTLTNRFYHRLSIG